jgi:hypothetical protein
MGAARFERLGGGRDSGAREVFEDLGHETLEHGIEVVVPEATACEASRTN